MQKKPLSHKTFVIGVSIACLLSWVGWYLVATRLNPFGNSYIPLALFYLTFFFGCSTAATLIGYGIRRLIYRKEVYFVHLNLTLRQGILLGGLAFFLLLFQEYRVLTWWDSALLVAVVVLLEFYFISRSRKW